MKFQPFHDDPYKRRAHIARADAMMPHLSARLAWDRKQIDQYRTRALRSLLTSAKSSSPWHARRLSDVDTSRASLAELARLPAMTKSDLMENWDDIVAVPGASLSKAEAVLKDLKDHNYVWSDHTLLASGGTGGRPGVFLYDWNGLATNFVSSFRAVWPVVASRVDASRAVRTVAIGAENSAHGSYVMARVFANPANPTTLLSAWRSTEEVVDRLNRLQPEVMSCYPSMVPALAQAATRGELAIAPAVILYVSEHLSPANLALTKTTWPEAAVLTFWATSEAGASFPCPCCDGGFHISEDLVLIEPAGDVTVVDGAELMDGIYITNFYNRAMPIIRYYIDDIFELALGDCPCGSKYRKVKQVHGRRFERFHYGDISVHPLALELAVLKRPSIVSYQIAQRTDGVNVSYVSDVAIDEGALHREIQQALDGYGLHDLETALSRVDAIQRTPAGKLKRFVPLC